MKAKFLTLLISLISCNDVFSQENVITISFRGEMVDSVFANNNSPLFERFSKWIWIINGDSLKVNSEKTTFSVNENSFDTLLFVKGENPPRTILMSFIPGDDYQIFWNPCCDDFDIESTTLLEQLDSMEAIKQMKHPKIYGTVQFKLKHCPTEDTMAGIFGDIFGGFSGGILVNQNSAGSVLTPWRTGYSTHNYTIGFANVGHKPTLNFD